jgi:hypothetical protein
MLQLSTLAAPPPGRPCTAEEVAQQESIANLILRGLPLAQNLGDEQGPAEISDNSCPGDRLVRLTLRAWRSARELASQGGVGELLRPTLTIVNDELERLRTGDLALEAEYAQTAIRAAIAAAQDERPEMELLLAHARDLTERLAARSRRALWPRPFNLLAGELWLEVDRYEDARVAYERAVTDRATPLALSGLARALARLARHPEACQAYGRIRDDAGPLRDEVRAYLARCP